MCDIDVRERRLKPGGELERVDAAMIARPRAPPHRGEPDHSPRFALVPLGQRERPRRRTPRRRSRWSHRARSAPPLRDARARGRGADRRAKVFAQSRRRQRWRDDGLPTPVARAPAGLAGRGDSPDPRWDRARTGKATPVQDRLLIFVQHHILFFYTCI